MQRTIHEKRLKNGFEMPIEIYDACTVRSLSNSATSFHYHEHVEILFADGECDLECLLADECVRFKTGDMLIISSFVPHTFISHLPKNKYICVKVMPDMLYCSKHPFFDVRYAEPFFKNQDSKFLLLSSHELSGEDISKMFADILSEWRGKRFGYEIFLTGAILQIFLRAVRYADTRKIYSSYSDTGELSGNTRLVYKSVEHINSDYADITEMQAADRVNMSYSHYSREFKRVMGVSFREYLSCIRLNSAQRLLLTTDMSITEVALASGFGTSSYFIESFKRSRGMTPASYRKLYSKMCEQD